jgi:formylglycine-generating enzyme required for sulfatase activity
MGADPSGETGSSTYATPAHPVVVSRAFWIQQTEATRRHWAEWTGSKGTPPGFDECGLDCPVTHLTYWDRLALANRLSDLEGRERCYELHDCAGTEGPWGWQCGSADAVGQSCRGYRLPTEAELTLAFGGDDHGCAVDEPAPGTADQCAWSEVANDLGWYCWNSMVTYKGCFDCFKGTGNWTAPHNRCCGPHVVALKRVNPFGLYDLHGNVEEPTSSVLEPFDSSAAVDPGHSAMIAAGDAVVYKGGAASYSALSMCSSGRGGALSDLHWYYYWQWGLRLVRTDFESE